MKIKKHGVDVIVDMLMLVLAGQMLTILVAILALVCEFRMFKDVVECQMPTVVVEAIAELQIGLVCNRFAVAEVC